MTHSVGAVEWTHHDTLLMAFGALTMIGIVTLIAGARVHPFIALTLASAGLGMAVGLPHDKALAAFGKGVGATLSGVGIVIVLGATTGKLLAISGGADRVVSSIVDRAGPRSMPWAIALGATLIGIPLFFEVSVVLIMPIILTIARTTRRSSLRVAIPALAGVSVAHGLLPPHPAPLVAARLLSADVGQTLAYGLLVAVPTVAVAGPVFGGWISNRIDPRTRGGNLDPPATIPSSDDSPSLSIALLTLLLPVGLMLLRAGVDVAGVSGAWRERADLVGHPVAALVPSLGLAMLTVGRSRKSGLPPMGAVILDSLVSVVGLVAIIGAGGGFKETLIESGIGSSIAKVAQSSSVPPLLLGWLIAVGVRVATGSATVATVTASGIVAPLIPTLHHVNPALLALSIGAGSLFFSHVNDAGFWLVKESLGMTVGETIRSWSAMETLVSVVAMACLLALSAIY
jgi:gluconate:H+ symporter, GntP family